MKFIAPAALFLCFFPACITAGAAVSDTQAPDNEYRHDAIRAMWRPTAQ